MAIEATEAVTTGARGKGAVGSVSATVKVIVSEEAKFPKVSLAKTVRLCEPAGNSFKVAFSAMVTGLLHPSCNLSMTLAQLWLQSTE